MKKIICEVIPYEAMRQGYVGDYEEMKDASWRLTVADTGDRRANMLIMIHEMIELFLTQEAGTPESVIAVFDRLFDEEREAGLHAEDAEPGDDPRAPYVNEHCVATGVERLLCAYLRYAWADYEAACERLYKPES